MSQTYNYIIILPRVIIIIQLKRNNKAIMRDTLVSNNHDTQNLINDGL